MMLLDRMIKMKNVVWCLWMFVVVVKGCLD